MLCDPLAGSAWDAGLARNILLEYNSRMDRRPGRRPQRRREILEAALAAFAERGFAATTIDDVRRASGASTGSLYHHFGGKAGLAGAVYLEGLRDYHESLEARLAEVAGAEALVKGVVLHYADWVAEHPAWARYLLEMRRAGSVRAVEKEIRALTRRAFRRLEGRLAPFVREGSLSKLPAELYAAVILGPSQSLAAAWIPRGRRDELRAAAPVLAEAAWRALSHPF